MQGQDYSYAYHDAPPSACPEDGWKRLAVHGLIETLAVVKQLEAGMSALGYPRKDSFAVGLVLREAVSNAVRHGHRGDKTRSVMINYTSWIRFNKRGNRVMLCKRRSAT